MRTGSVGVGLGEERTGTRGEEENRANQAGAHVSVDEPPDRAVPGLDSAA